MSTKTIHCKTVPTGLTCGEKPVNRFVVVNNGVANEDVIYQGVSRKTGQPFALVKATGSLMFSEIGENLGLGFRVEMREMSAFLTLPGMVESVSAESRRETPLVPTVHLVAKGDFKRCCQGPEFVVENVTRGATVVVDGVIDDLSQTPDVITRGSNVEIHVTGRGLYMPDLDDPTVGAYIADSAGRVLAKANVTESTVVTLTCTVALLDMEEGTYKFCVASRNGLDPVQYGVTIASRNVRVVNANSGEAGV